MRLAKKAYPNRQVRVQPSPNAVGTDVFEIHTRPERSQELHDFDWKLVEKGEEESLLRSLRFKANHPEE